MGKRFYRFKLISYLSEDEIVKCLGNENINHYAYILHDKDTKEDGELKEKHYHILVTLRNQRSIEGIRNDFKGESEQNTLAKPIEDITHDYRYLTHEDDEDKVKYDKDDIKTDDKTYWGRVAKDEIVTTDANEEFIRDLTADNISYKNMALKYGRDFIKNRRQYIEYRVLLRAEERKELKEIRSEEDLKIFADEEQKTIIQANQFKQYYGEQQSIYKS